MSGGEIKAIVGSDEGLVKTAAQKCYARLAEGTDEEFSNEIIDGVAEDSGASAKAIHQTIQALQTLPFFGRKVVWLKNANFFGTDRTSEAAATLEAGEALIEVLDQGLPNNVDFLISATAINKSRKFYKRLQKLADIELHEKIDTSKAGWEEKVKDLVLRRCRDIGVTFEHEALEIFVRLAGEATAQIDSELEKLLLYVGTDREINVEDVRRMVPLTHAGIIFEIGECLARRQGARALELIDQQLERGESGVAIMRASITPTIRNLFFAKLLMEEHGVRGGSPRSFSQAVERLPSSTTAFLPRTKAGKLNVWGLGFASGNAAHFSLRGLRSAMEFCLEADRSLVTTQLGERLVLHRLVGRLLAAAAPNKRKPARRS